MKNRLILFAFLFSLSNICFAQRLKWAYLDSFSIRNISSDILALIKKDLDYNFENELKKKGFTFSSHQKKLFLNTFENTYEKARKEIAGIDFLANLPSEVEKYAIEQLAYQSYSIFPKSVSSYIPQEILIDKAVFFGKYYDDFIRDIPELNEKIKEIVTIKFKAYKRKFAEELNSTKYSLYSKFEQEFNKIEIEFSEFKGKLENEIGEFNNAINRYAYSLRKDFNKFTGYASDDALREAATIFKREFEYGFNTIKGKVTEEFNKIPESLKKIRESENKISGFLDKINSEADKQKAELKHLEESIKKRVTETGQKVSKEVLELKSKYDKCAKRIDFLINMGKDIIGGKVNYEQLSLRLKDKALERVFSEKGSKFFTETLNKEFKNLNAEDVENMIAATQGFANSLQEWGVLKGKDAQRVNKFLTYASAAVQVGTGVGKLFAGDPSGVFNIMQGIGGLSSKGPKESAEMQMLKQINERLDLITDRLDTIQKDIERLDQKVTELYIQMVQSFQVINHKLDNISDQLDDIQIITRNILYNQYNSCPLIINVLNKSKKKFDSYKDYSGAYTNDLAYCLEGLYKLAATSDEDFFLLSISEKYINKRKIEFQTDSIYKPLLLLSRYFYTNRYSLNSFFNSNLFAVKYPIYLNKPFFYPKKTTLADYAYDASMDKLFNPEMIYSYVEIYDKLSPYFLFSLKDESFEPDRLEDYLLRPSFQHEMKLSLHEKRLEKLYNITNKALIQQNMISGNILINNILSTYKSDVPRTIIDTISTILEKNKLLSSNIVLSLLANSWQINPDSKDTSIVKSEKADFSLSGNSTLRYGSIYSTQDSTVISQYKITIPRIDSLTHVIKSDRRPDNREKQTQRISFLKSLIQDFNEFIYIDTVSADGFFQYEINPIILKDTKEDIWISDITDSLSLRFHNTYNRELMSIYDSIFIFKDNLDTLEKNQKILREKSYTNNSVKVRNFDNVLRKVYTYTDSLNTRIREFDNTGHDYKFVFDSTSLQVSIHLKPVLYDTVTVLAAPDPYELRDPKLNYTQSVYRLLEARRILKDRLMGVKFNKYLPDKCNGIIDEKLYKLVSQ